SWQHYQENRQNPFERRSANAGSFCNDYSSRSPSGR
ncbi:transposase, partial [Shigella flexneri]